MPKKTLPNIDFRLKWKSPIAEHTDIFHIENIDLNKDILPTNFGEKISNLTVDESYSVKLQAKDLLGEGYSSDKVISFDIALFNNQFKNQYSPPSLYRFYPSAIAWKGLNTSDNDYSPFRLISKNQETIVADLNHPLAKYYLTLTATKVEQSNNDSKNRPQRDITNLISTKGPGMQAPFEFGDPIFFNEYPFKKNKDNKEHKNEVLKPNIESVAKQQIESLYSELLPKHSKILDVLSNNCSYLANNYQTGFLAGIGDDEKLLSENKRLDTYTTQDLNSDLTLPFESNSFDAAICTLAIETLSNPLELMKEIVRVVNQKGKFIITFVNVYSPDQSISLWSQLHPFERIQLVLEYFRESGLFAELNTVSNRGRSKNSIYAVWGTVNQL